MDHELWTMDGPWAIDHESWSIECRVWSVEYGVSSMEYKVWTMEYEVWSIEYEVLWGTMGYHWMGTMGSYGFLSGIMRHHGVP